LKNNALKINEKDNVAIAMHDVKKGEAVVVDGQELLEVLENIEAGHKIALASLATGEKVYRYGEPIVEATSGIKRGEWVHVHNTQPIKGELEE
jgi:altronate hydrolase